MRQTLCYIPHEIGHIHVFGFGWLLGFWAVLSVLCVVRSVAVHGWSAETRSLLPILGVVGLVIAFVIPQLEETAAGATLGVPIRGYGVLLLLAVVAGVALAAQRARRMGLDPELIYSLAFWLFVGGIVGARLFYVLQYWDQFHQQNLLAFIGAVLNVAKGGLVVYGSLFGALAAGWWCMRRRGLPVLATADLIAPSLALGLSIGRIGCLLNGCCYGGLCAHPWAVTFPQHASPYTEMESPPYAHQHQLGILHGFQLADNAHGQPVVGSVLDDSDTAASQLRVGEQIRAINGFPVDSMAAAQEVLAISGPHLVIETADGPVAEISTGRLPPRSRPVHPTQVYSAINAALLCLVLLTFYPFRRRDGEVLALLLTLYPVTRFLLEIIRTDEIARFGSGFTISQSVSLLVFPLVAGFWIYLLRQPRGSVLPVPAPWNNRAQNDV